MNKIELKSSHYSISKPNNDDWVLCFSKQDIYLKDNRILKFADICNINLESSPEFYCFAQAGAQRFLLLDDKNQLNEISRLEPVFLKRAWQFFDNNLKKITTLACHLAHWRLSHRYCGGCGKRLKDKEDERARVCEECGIIVYPRISPCVMVLITKGQQLLLARSPHFGAGIYSALAGFIEPGESVEEAIHREVFEEVGIKIKNLQYVGSQPWPFPDSLMLSFVAQYQSGAISIDNKEIEDAQWFGLDNLPKLPSKMSIARALIEYQMERMD